MKKSALSVAMDFTLLTLTMKKLMVESDTYVPHACSSSLEIKFPTGQPSGKVRMKSEVRLFFRVTRLIKILEHYRNIGISLFSLINFLYIM